MRIEARDAVEMIAAGPVLDAEAIICRVNSCVDTLVRPFRISSYCRHVHIVPGISPDMGGIFTVFCIMNVVAFGTVFAISYVVSGAVFTLQDMTEFFR